MAKKRTLLRLLHEAFRACEVGKQYQLLVRGQWPKRLSVVKQPLHRYVAQNGERFVRVDVERGQAAQTGFEVVERFSEATWLKAMPKTGRTHQIRVHAAWAACPIINDAKYDMQAGPIWAKALGKRHFLHCSGLTLPKELGWDPFEAPMGPVLQAVLDQLR